MRQTWIVGGLAALTLVAPGVLRPAGAEPTKYCGDRITEAEDTVKEVEAALGRLQNAQDKTEIESRLAEAKRYIGAAKAAGQEEECVRQVELAKTLSQDALYHIAQAQ